MGGMGAGGISSGRMDMAGTARISGPFEFEMLLLRDLDFSLFRGNTFSFDIALFDRDRSRDVDDVDVDEDDDVCLFRRLEFFELLERVLDRLLLRERTRLKIRKNVLICEAEAHAMSKIEVCGTSHGFKCVQ